MPRLPFHLKHTLVRTAIKNGVVFEINYAGAFGGGESEGTVGESSSSMKRNWWASAREVVRVTKGKGLVVSGGVLTEADLRAPRDISNLQAPLSTSMSRTKLGQQDYNAGSGTRPRSQGFYKGAALSYITCT